MARQVPKGFDWYVLCVVAVGASAAAIGGWDKGWAYAHKTDLNGKGGPFGPPSVDVTVCVGWWNSTSSMKVSTYFPIQIESQGSAAKSLGAVVCAALIVSVVTGVYALCSTLIEQPPLLGARNGPRVCALLGASLLILSIALYIALAIGVNNQFKEKFEKGIFARPDWAWACSLVATLCWVALGYRLQQPSGPDGYSPI